MARSVAVQPTEKRQRQENGYAAARVKGEKVASMRVARARREL